ncbi:zinc-binding dehydrogenase [Pendulispora rubella]|uniref:Zinc-binding dehydrogenase n=1 Tax=Pendulispora rubella TaxID=2741070 RepID=A0ABZ2LHQ0_9BACT
MQAIVIRETGDPSVLRLEDVARPEPGPGEVLLRVGAVSVNRSYDLAVRAGTSPFQPTLPVTPGVDPSGEIVETGAGVDRARIGTRVAVLGMVRCGACQPCASGKRCTYNKPIGLQAPGGCAEYVAVHELQVRPIPDALGFAEATVLCRHGAAATAEIATAALRAGEWALVMGAAGGLGNVLVQLAKLAGAKVIAAAGSAPRVKAALESGADAGIDYRAQDLAAEVHRITGGHGADVVFENIGDPSLWTAAFQSLTTGGRLVTMGYHGGGVVPLDVKQLHLKRLRVLSSAPAKGDTDLMRCFTLGAEGKLKALIGRRFPLEQTALAHELAESGSVIGKIIIEPGRTSVE